MSGETIRSIEDVAVTFEDNVPSKIGTVKIPFYERMLWKALAAHEQREANESISSAKIAYALSRHYAWSEEDVDLSTRAGFGHDFGKMAINKSVLNKPGPLTPQERAYMALHAELSRILLDPHYPGFYQPLLDKLGVQPPYHALDELLRGLGVPVDIIAQRNVFKQHTPGHILMVYNDGTQVAHTPTSLHQAQLSFIAGSHHMCDGYPYHQDDPGYNVERIHLDDLKTTGIPLRDHIATIQLIQAIDGMLAEERPYRNGSKPFSFILEEVQRVFVTNGGRDKAKIHGDTKRIVSLAAPPGYEHTA